MTSTYVKRKLNTLNEGSGSPQSTLEQQMNNVENSEKRSGRPKSGQANLNSGILKKRPLTTKLSFQTRPESGLLASPAAHQTINLPPGGLQQQHRVSNRQQQQQQQDHHGGLFMHRDLAHANANTKKKRTDGEIITNQMLDAEQVVQARKRPSVHGLFSRRFNNSQRSQIEIPLRDKIILGPIDKYIKYNRFPWKMVLHIILVFLTSYHCWLVQFRQTAFSRRTYKFFYNEFMVGLDDETAPFGTFIELYNIESLKEYTTSSINSYFGLENINTLDRYFNPREEDGSIIPVTMTVMMTNPQQEVQLYGLTEDDLGPFAMEDTELKKEIQSWKAFYLDWSTKQIMPTDAVTATSCVEYNFVQSYDFTNRGNIEVRLTIERQGCRINGKIGDFIDQKPVTWLPITIIIIAFIQLCFAVVYVRSMSKYFNKLQKDYEQKMREVYGLDKDEISAQEEQKTLLKSYMQIEKKNNVFEEQDAIIRATVDGTAAKQAVSESIAASTQPKVNVSGEQPNPQPKSTLISSNMRMSSLANSVVDEKQIAQDAILFAQQTNQIPTNRQMNHQTAQFVSEVISQSGFNDYQSDDSDEQRRKARQQVTTSQSLPQNQNLNLSNDSVELLSLSDLSTHSDMNEDELEQVIRTNYVQKKISWSALSFWDKARIFNKWAFLLALGNIFSIFGSLFQITNIHFRFVYIEIFVSAGCFLTWATISKYFANTTKYTLMTRTFEEAVPLLMKVMVGAGPIFFGFFFFGMCVFWQYDEKWGTFSNGAFILFATMNGDSVCELYLHTTPARFFSGWFFTYIWVFMAIVVIQNLNCVIVEDSYLTVKYKSNFSWLRDEQEEQGAQIEEGNGGQGHGHGGEGPNAGGSPKSIANKSSFQDYIPAHSVSMALPQENSTMQNESTFVPGDKTGEAEVVETKGVTNFKRSIAQIVLRSVLSNDASGAIVIPDKVAAEKEEEAAASALDTSMSTSLAVIKTKFDNVNKLVDDKELKSLKKATIDMTVLKKFKDQEKHTKIEDKFEKLTNGTREDAAFSKKACIKLREDIDAELALILKLKSKILDVCDLIKDEKTALPTRSMRRTQSFLITESPKGFADMVRKTTSKDV